MSGALAFQVVMARHVTAVWRGTWSDTDGWDTPGHEGETPVA
jgi:hypothetical protein